MAFLLSDTDANPDKDTTEQFKMLNRAYEVLRDPKLRQSYDRFGNKGIGTSAASDMENSQRRQPKPSSSTNNRSSSSWASESTARSNGYASDFGSNWASGTKTGKTGTGQGKSSPNSGDTSVDPFSVNKRAPYTPKKENFEWSSYQDPGFRPRPQAAASPSGKSYQSEAKAVDDSTYYGDMGSVHSQRGFGTRFEDKMFEFRDGVSSGEAFFGRGPKFGRDVQISIELDTNVTRTGGRKMIEVKHMRSCSTCKGTGTADSSSTIRPCAHCGGSGYKTSSSMMREICPHCMGSGRTVTNPCRSCNGLGMQQTTSMVEINVPRNVDDGYTLRVPGEGDAGPNCGPSGDLYVSLKVQGTSRGTQKPSGSAVPGPNQARGGSSSTTAKAAPKKVSGGLTPDQPRTSRSARPVSRTPVKRSRGLRPDSVRAGLTPPVPMAPERTPIAQRTASDAVSRPQSSKVPMTPERTPTAQRTASETVSRPQPNKVTMTPERMQTAQRSASESVSRPQQSQANASRSSARRNVVERSRVPPAQAQADRFGSTRVVPPTVDDTTSLSDAVPQSRRGRLRGIRNFVTNILNR